MSSSDSRATYETWSLFLIEPWEFALRLGGLRDVRGEGPRQERTLEASSGPHPLSTRIDLHQDLPRRGFGEVQKSQALRAEDVALNSQAHPSLRLQRLRD